MATLVAGRGVLDWLTEEVLRYSDLYISSDPGSLILLSEAFGFDFIERNARRRLQALASTLQGLVVKHNPLYGYYLPYLYVLGSRVEPKLAEVARRTALELVGRFGEGSYGGLGDRIRRSPALRRGVRKFLATAALSAKYLVELSGQPPWRELASLYVGRVFESLMGSVEAGGLDPVGQVALLVLYEHVNEVRQRSGLLRYELPKGVSWSILHEKVASTKEITKASVVALLYDLYTSPYAGSDARIAFLQLASSVHLDKLSIELAGRARESEEDAELYLKYYGVDSLAPTPGLDEVEYALLARFLRILREEYIYVPIHGLSEFVSRYYSIPEGLLKVFLFTAYIRLELYWLVLKACSLMLENVITPISTAISVLSPEILSALRIELKPPMDALMVRLIAFVVTLFTTVLAERANKLPKLRKLEARLAGIKNKVKSKAEKVSREAEETRMRLRYFKWYIKPSHRNHGLS
ncbi:MAG: hypothetical protein LM564_02375 [Desulfurococcaceae archaeon]|nr:hypothetical protein [Desulfurococcaceae archaeon]